MGIQVVLAAIMICATVASVILVVALLCGFLR